MSVTLKGSLPSDDRNGLGMISSALVDDPEAVHIIVALVDCTKITTNVQSGDVIPTARIRHIEAFPGVTSDASDVRRLLRRAFERRTGKVELPIEFERAIDDISPEQ